MGGNDSGGPRAYSTQLDGSYDSGYHADGYNVVIEPGQLEESIRTYKRGLGGLGPTDLNTTIVNALIDAGAFGDLPNATSAYQELFTFVQNHMDAMRQMGVSLDDFVARVQAAADLGYQADPVTQRQAAFLRAHARME